MMENPKLTESIFYFLPLGFVLFWRKKNKKEILKFFFLLELTSDEVEISTENWTGCVNAVFDSADKH